MSGSREYVSTPSIQPRTYNADPTVDYFCFLRMVSRPVVIVRVDQAVVMPDPLLG